LAGRNPVPYLLGLAVSANVGSMATIIGNPQNILIGNSSGIPFIRFTGYLVIPAIFGLFICWLVILLLFRREFALPLKIPGTLHLRPIYKPLFIKSLVSVGLMLVLIIAGVQVTLAALSASALLLFTRRIKPQRVFREIDISLLVFFSGLFIITSAVWKLGFYNTLIERLLPYLQNNLPLFGIFSAFLSNLISNVPAVMLLSPLIARFPSQELAWIFLAMSSTLAGNLTLLGSVANLIVAESAESRGYRLSFLTYLKVGFPVTILTITVSTLFLILI